MNKIGYWLLIAAIVVVALFFIGKYLFPALISELAALLVGLLVFVSGLFLRRKKSSN